jgi:hypothetical protein
MTMETIKTAILLLALAPGSLAAADSSRGVGVSLRVRDQVVRLYSESHALIVGAADYTNGWPPLSGVKDDVAAVRAELMEHGFETTVVMNPTHDQLLSAFGKFVAKHGQQQDARLLIYFAGHGHTLRTSDGRQLGYIVPVDAPNPNVDRDEFKRLAISMTEFDLLAQQIESKHVLFVFDSCFAGTIFETTRGVPDEISEKTARPVRQFITAGDADQQVPDRSIFRSEFVEGLRGEADLNHDGYITGSELGMYLESKVTTYSHRTQTPKSGKLARQNLDKGDFVFMVPSPTITVALQGARAGAGNAAQSAAAPDPRAVELEFWNSIKSEADPEYFKDYLHRYPDGMFASIASVRLRNLTALPVRTNPQPALSSSAAPSGLTSPAEGNGEPSAFARPIATTVPSVPAPQPPTVPPESARLAGIGEGLWMPEQVPHFAQELRKAGLQVDPQRLADLSGDPMGAVVSLGGCSASFVSKDGLIVTNHHCGFGALQYNSSTGRDLITNGFLARTPEAELPAGPGTRVFVTTGIEDVTDRVTGRLEAKESNPDRMKEIDRNIKQLVDECEKPGGARCRVASFFEGLQYLRTTQMEIRDVRLVYAPALGIGDFGGETDNWMWPRHTGDWSFLRAYVGRDGRPADYSKDNVPYHPAHFLKVSVEGVKPGDLVIVAGFPGRTFRYRTAAEIRNMQEYVYPTTIRYATDLNNILRELGKKDRNTDIANASRIKGNESVLKNFTGTLTGFEKFHVLAQRQKREADLKVWIASRLDARPYATALDKMNALEQQQVATRERDLVLSWLLRSSPMLTQANTLYRLSMERTRADMEREVGFQERDWARIAESVNRAQKSLEAGSDRAGLHYILNQAVKLTASQRITALDDSVAKAGGVEKFLDQLYANTKIDDLAARKTMLSENTAQLRARHDAFLDLAAALTPLKIENELHEKEMGGSMSRIRPLYMEALREMAGGTLYPDANGSLRITFGQIEGYSPRPGVWFTPQTGVGGIVAKNTGSGEFDAPRGEIEAINEKRFDGYVTAQLGEVPVDFLSTADTTGGDSGSPTLNRKGELCGLVFDGTYESLGSDFLVDPKVTRSIHVDAVYMLWVMDAVDRAHNLLREMNIPVRYPQ